MTRIGPTAAAATLSREAKPPKNGTGCKPCAAIKATRRTRRAMCVVCEAGRPVCKRSGAGVQLHIEGQPCPRGWHPDKRGRVRWAGVAWSGVPFPLRLWLWLRLDDRDHDEFVASFAGCGCVRSLKAAWMWLVRKWRKNENTRPRP